MEEKKMLFRTNNPTTFDGDKWTFEVIVMAEVDGYAMVRRPHCMPFVVGRDQLHTKEEMEGNEGD